MRKPIVIVIAGPTASGKTALGVLLAKKIGGEVISADSMQIYKDMTIGTAKPIPEEMDGVPHHLIDFVSPDSRYSVADFKKDAEKKIEEILKKGKVPIVVGGTGLYIDTLIYGIEYPEIGIDEQLRKKLMKEAETEEGLAKLYEQAKKIDEKAIEKVSRSDAKRIVRIIEIYNMTGKTKTEIEAESRKKDVKYDFKVFAINMDREKLYERINLRVDLMMEAGLVKEVENLLNKYNKFPTAMQGLGYKEVVQYFNKELTENEMIEKIKQESRRYAKRQLTWFRKNKNIIWLDGLEEKQKNIDIIINNVEN